MWLLWISVIIVLIIVILLTVVRCFKFYKHEHFICPKCNKSFKPPLLKLLFSVNAVEGKIICCPYCGEKSYIEPTRD